MRAETAIGEPVSQSSRIGTPHFGIKAIKLCSTPHFLRSPYAVRHAVKEFGSGNSHGSC
jgi:hypothetical protein